MYVKPLGLFFFLYLDQMTESHLSNAHIPSDVHGTSLIIVGGWPWMCFLIIFIA